MRGATGLNGRVYVFALRQLFLVVEERRRQRQEVGVDRSSLNCLCFHIKLPSN